MAVIRMTLGRYVAYRQRIAERFLPAAMRGALSAAMRGRVVVERLTREAPAANPAGVGSGGAVDTGAFLRAWKAEATQDGARLYNDAPHAPIVERGRRAGAAMPPPDAIARWVRRRLGVSESEARSVAFVVARAIATRGLVGRKIAERAAPEIAKLAVDEIRRELDLEMLAG
jgi:hypothetical protein